ncbi:NifU family protein [Gilvibacter sediminis]|uniref:NifU family protein n=1 Tax=Gilvibacter sediminis TaxID=379071 RepID=UPI002350F024|nr:NifU family protein [Gilvibacter sediminis]MDC7996389.1 NifU family protein [Gilvibacter sediminis]
MENRRVTVEPTSQPAIVKFVTDTFLTQSESFEFANIDEAGRSPLAKELFFLPFVKTVYISQNFVAIERYNIVEWTDVQDQVADQIAEYLDSGKPVITAAEAPKNVPVSVYAEVTPNPAVMKFVANKTLVNDTYEFKTLESAKNAPLALRLFRFPFVKEVFMSGNYISIMKLEGIEWQEVTQELRDFITQYVAQGKTILDDAILTEERTPEAQVVPIKPQELEGISKEIVEILDEYVKPAVAGDGGNIAFDSYDANTKTVKVILQGACSGCPSSTVTLKNGIETMLREMLQGKVSYVEAING